jgi:hypothetical protein
VIYGAIVLTIYFLKAISIIVSRDLWAIASTIYFLKAIAISMSRDYGAIALSSVAIALLKI